MNAQQQIKELRKEFNDKLNKLEQQIKPTIKVGKVYNVQFEENKNSNYIIGMITKIENNYKNWYYGISNNGFRQKDYFVNIDNVFSITEATPEEWVSALSKEAERRGYKDGVKVISVWSGEEQVLIDDDSFWDENGFLYKRNYILNTKGEWATICESEVKHDIEITDNGYRNISMLQSVNELPVGKYKLTKID